MALELYASENLDGLHRRDWERIGQFLNFAGWVETGIARMAMEETQPAKN